MSVGTMPVGKIIARAVETILVAWLFYYVITLWASGKEDAALNNAVVALAIVAFVEASMRLVPRVVAWAETKSHVSSDEVFFRGIQAIILAVMAADAATWLIKGHGLGSTSPVVFSPW